MPFSTLPFLPITEFCKTAATATTFSPGTTMNRAFRRVVAAPFFYAEKRAAATTFTPFLSQNDRRKGKIHETEDDHTPEKGGGYDHTEAGHRADRTKHTEG